MSKVSSLTDLRKWLIRESGLSSATLVYALVPKLRREAEARNRSFGIGNFPYDPDDFSRCRKALSMIRDGRSKLHLVAEMFPRWKPLVDNWDELEALFVEESPKHNCPKMCARMQELMFGKGDRR